MGSVIHFKKTVRPVVILTGSASGIGFELAKLLYNDESVRAIVTARSHHLSFLRTQFKESRRFKVRSLDVTNEENIYSLVNETCRDWGRIDVIINNAAICFRGVVEHMDSEEEMIQLKTNYLGPMALIRAALPIMREQRSGQIINVSSASGMLAMPTMGSYSASKHALEGASEALWYEARPFGIRVNLVELGFIKSSSFKNVILSKKAKISSSVQGPHSEYYRSMTPFIEKLMSLSISTPTSVAKRILKVIHHRPSRLRIIGTPDMVIYGFLRFIFPVSILNIVMYLLLPGSTSWGGYWKKDAKGADREKKSPRANAVDVVL